MPYAVYHKQNYKALKNMVRLASIISFVLAVINSVIGNVVLASLEYMIFLLCSILLWRFKKWITANTIKLFSVIFASLLLSVMMYAFTSQHMTSWVYLWVILIPLIAYNITGLYYGFVLSCIFTALSGVIFFRVNHIDPASIDLIAFSNVFICLLTAWILTHFYENSNSYSKKRLTYLASIDPLTGLYNRYALQEIHKMHNTDYKSLIILDIDFFKKINDTYGHDAGDYVLRVVSELLLDIAPDSASVFRLGGEEFGVLLPKSSLDSAVELAHELLKEIRNCDIYYQGKRINITASAGASSVPADVELNELMKAADKCLYKAKETGRNQVLACN